MSRKTVTTRLLTGRWYNGDVSVELRDADQQVVATGQGTSGTLQVVNPHLWQPGEGYLYELCVTAKSQTECDIYPLRVGIRSVAVKGEQFLINHKPFYFTGFGRHEDADLRGKGFDNVLMVHDHALMDWIGANSYRTSHYPLTLKRCSTGQMNMASW